jgi:thioesterase domain-containing protein
MAISSSPLVAIQPEGSRPPLFLAHPSGGGVLCYRELACHLGPDQPLYGLQDPSLEGDEEPLGDIEAMAARYIATAREAQPHGPYLLGGYSFGGLIAFQMAQDLIRQGETVALLVFIESMSPVDSKEILNQNA